MIHHLPSSKLGRHGSAQHKKLNMDEWRVGNAKQMKGLRLNEKLKRTASNPAQSYRRPIG